MTASDSHRAAVREKIAKKLVEYYGDSRLQKQVQPMLIHDIMALLDAERERWTSEVRSRLPVKHYPETNDEIKAGNYVLDAVSRVLDSLSTK